MAAETFLSVNHWRERVRAHTARMEPRIGPARKRRDCGEAHPVEDFLFTYYSFSFAKLLEWHPPLGMALEASADLPAWFRLPPYRIVAGTVFADPTCLSPDQCRRLGQVRALLIATRERPANFRCHGLHEWAMVYQGAAVRHEKTVPLRLPQAAIDALVEERPIVCSHFDAFRFFPPAARPLNKLQPAPEARLRHEQPGCLHANMDLYKWCGKAMPWAGSDLWADTFELALKLRELDMRASPYDLRAYGLPPIAIETAAGRDEYEKSQRLLAECAMTLRERLIEALDFIDGLGPSGGSAAGRHPS